MREKLKDTPIHFIGHYLSMLRISVRGLLGGWGCNIDVVGLALLWDGYMVGHLIGCCRFLVKWIPIWKED